MRERERERERKREREKERDRKRKRDRERERARGECERNHHVHDVHTFQLLKNRVGTTQIIAGIDDPYPLGEMEDVEGSYPGKVLNEAQDIGIITEAEKDSIWCDNVWRWLGK